MSLVAYDASSDEESDFENNEGAKAIIATSVDSEKNQVRSKTDEESGQTSDEDDDFISNFADTEKYSANNFSKFLPKPKKDTNMCEILENFAKPTFGALPTPKPISSQINIEEDDDEYLRKRPSDEFVDKKGKNTGVRTMPVKITIPCLTKFNDVEQEIAEKARHRNAFSRTRNPGSSGLLSILPKAKSEQCFVKETLSKRSEAGVKKTTKPATPSFVPDSVKHRRPATNIEDVERRKPFKKVSKNNIQSLAHAGENDSSDDSDDDNAKSGDFFSFNSDQCLPEVSPTEISCLVEKMTTKMAKNSSDFLKSTETQKAHEDGLQVGEPESQSSKKRFHQDLNDEALHALVGGSTKRRRQQQSQIQVIELNSSEVMPNKDEWMRTALASSTTYQPTGVLVDEEPASGTRRKHQITYLAHKAKANEAELQAMWSVNRQNRRATQSKYGF